MEYIYIKGATRVATPRLAEYCTVLYCITDKIRVCLLYDDEAKKKRQKTLVAY